MHMFFPLLAVCLLSVFIMLQRHKQIVLFAVDVYSDCEKNRSLWSTLRLHEVIDLEDLLNVSKVSFIAVLLQTFLLE